MRSPANGGVGTSFPDWYSVFVAFGIDVPSNPMRHGSCPVCGGKDRFRFDNKNGSGSWFCNQGNSTHKRGKRAGDGFALVAEVLGISRREAVRKIREIVDCPSSPSLKTLPLQPVRGRKSNIEHARRLYGTGTPARKHHAAKKYFEARGIPRTLEIASSSGLRIIEMRCNNGDIAPVLVAPMRSLSGELEGIQRTGLDWSGEKKNVPGADVDKAMLGKKKSGGTVPESYGFRIGEDGFRLFIGEGLETTLSGLEAYENQGNGYVAWDAGNLQIVPVSIAEQYRAVIILADNDASGVGHKAAITLAMRLFKDGILCTIALPPVVGTDWNDVIREAGPTETRRLIETAPPYLPEGWEKSRKALRGGPSPDAILHLRLPEAESRLKNLMDETAEGMHLIKAVPGLGKTRAMVEWIARNNGCQVEIFEPTLEKGEEVRTDLAKHGVPAVVVRGRDATNPLTGKKMCRYSSGYLEEFTRRNLPIYPHLCEIPTDTGRPLRCESFESCAWIEQFHGDHRVRIMSHSYLPLLFSRIEGEDWHPLRSFIDESFQSQALRSKSCEIDGIVQDKGGEQWHALKKNILEAAGKLAHQPVPVSAFGLNQWAIREEISAEIRSLGIVPGMPEEQGREMFSEIPLPSLSSLMLRKIAQELESNPGRTSLRCLEIMPARNEVGLVSLVWKKEMARLAKQKNVTILDASGDSEIYRHVLDKEITTHEINVQSHAEIIQVSDRTFAKSSLVQQKESGTHILSDFGWKTVMLLQELSLKNRTIIVTYMRVEELIRPHLPGVEIRHFGNLRGIDLFKDFDQAIIVGRNMPSPVDVRRMVRALYRDDAKPLDFSMKTVLVPYRMANGSPACLPVGQYVDSRTRAVVEIIREEETLQAMHRLRLVRREGNPPRVVLFSNLPILGLSVDHLRNIDQIVSEIAPQIPIRGSEARLREAFEREGFLPLSGTVAHRMIQGVWNSPRTAEHDLKSISTSGANCLYRVLYTSCASGRNAKDPAPEPKIELLEYHPTGERKKILRIVYDPARLNLRDLLSRLLALVGPGKWRGSGEGEYWQTEIPGEPSPENQEWLRDEEWEGEDFFDSSLPLFLLGGGEVPPECCLFQKKTGKNKPED